MIPSSVVFSFVMAAILTAVLPIIILTCSRGKKKNQGLAFAVWHGGALSVTICIAYAAFEHAVKENLVSGLCRTVCPVRIILIFQRGLI